MVRLVGETVALRGDHAQAKRFLMDGLLRMVDADCWAWTLGYLHPDKPPIYVSIQHGGFSPEGFAKYIHAVEHPEMQELTAPFSREIMEAEGQVTRLRQEIDGKNRFEESAAYPVWIEADLEALMLSAKPLDRASTSLIAIYRRAGRPLFNERERQIAHILLSEVPWLHATGWPEDFGVQTPTLSRKKRLVLHLLLEGNSRKIVADQLELSVHTVCDYVKEIYQTFGVRSHAELMRRFTGAD